MSSNAMECRCSGGPLRDDEVTRFVDAARAGQERLGDFYAGLQFALAAMMVSPEFLLRIERTPPEAKQRDVMELDAWSKATRLSYFLTNSTPDDELLRAAGAGELETRRGLQRQVDRLIGSPLFEAAVRAFFQDMLQFDKFSDLAKDPVVYPAFNSTVAADAQEQTLRTITHLLIEEKGDYRDLFTTRDTFLTRALGVVYRVPVPTRNGWEPTEFATGKHREGIQSQIAFLALNSHPGRSSATLREQGAARSVSVPGSAGSTGECELRRGSGPIERGDADGARSLGRASNRTGMRGLSCRSPIRSG